MSRLATVAILSSALLLPVAASADSPPGSLDRHVVVVRPAVKPQGVPASYVLTRHGFFHPSCVIKLRADESIDDDGIIRDLRGQQREQLAPCAHPRFDRVGRLLAGAPAAPPRAAELPAPGTRVPHDYDGWVLSFGANIGEGFDFGSRLTYGIDWAVPKAPSKLGSQDIAFFSDIETLAPSPADPLGILQPVLEFNALNGRWWIISEFCCSPMDVQTEPIDVDVGDTIRGEIAGTSCASGVCQDWAVTTTDVTTGKSTVLHRSGLQRIEQINPSVLETFNVTSCDMLPASGATTFFNHKVTDGNGAALMLRYGKLVFSSDTPAELPRDCGWAVSSASSDQFTLTYGTTTVDAGAGPITDGSVASDLGFPPPNHDAALDAATDTAASTPTPRVDSGLPGIGGAENGCGCRLNDAHEAEGAATTLLGMAVVVLGSRVRRRRARRRRKSPWGMAALGALAAWGAGCAKVVMVSPDGGAHVAPADARPADLGAGGQSAGGTSGTAGLKGTGGAPTAPSDCQAANSTGSAQGCDFYAVVPQPSGDTGGPTCFVAMVANTGTSPVRITVDYAGMALDIGRLARMPRGSGAAQSYDPLPGGELPAGRMAILSLSGGGPVPCPSPTGLATDPVITGTGKGHSFHIATSAPVVAYDIYPFGGAASFISSATLLIPTSAWGINYVAADGYAADSDTPSEGPFVQVAAAEDGTEVTINPTAPIVGSGTVAASGRNQPQTYRLDKGEVLQLQQHDELSGSVLQSNKPIGVWGGSTCMFIPVDVAACDTAHQQLVPVNQLGTEYAAVRYRDRLDGRVETTPWTLVGAVDGTVLTYDPAPPGDAPTLINRGQTVRFDATKPFTVRSSANNPFYLAGHMTGGQLFTGMGDPETVNAVPPKRWLSSYLFVTDSTYGYTNLVFVRQRSGGAFLDVTLDCVGPLTNWSAVGADGLYQFTRVDLVKDGKPVGACDNGVHTAKSDAPFGLTVWGWDAVVSYAYPAGMGVRSINNVVIIP